LTSRIRLYTKSMFRALVIILLSIPTANALDIAALTNQIAQDEGLRLTPYKCTMGFKTVGYGHRCSANQLPITLETARKLLDNDVRKAVQEAREIVGDEVPDTVIEVVSQMCFQLGPKGVRGFKHMIKDIQQENYMSAANDMLHSDWYKQTPKRCLRLSKVMRNIDNDN
jgi:lysozyme